MEAYYIIVPNLMCLDIVINIGILLIYMMSTQSVKLWYLFMIWEEVGVINVLTACGLCLAVLPFNAPI
jgi:hypothetical protein